jgi:hypothetical protein
MCTLKSDVCLVIMFVWFAAIQHAAQACGLSLLPGRPSLGPSHTECISLCMLKDACVHSFQHEDSWCTAWKEGIMLCMASLCVRLPPGSCAATSAGTVPTPHLTSGLSCDRRGALCTPCCAVAGYLATRTTQLCTQLPGFWAVVVAVAGCCVTPPAGRAHMSTPPAWRCLQQREKAGACLALKTALMLSFAAQLGTLSKLSHPPVTLVKHLKAVVRNALTACLELHSQSVFYVCAPARPSTARSAQHPTRSDL